MAPGLREAEEKAGLKPLGILEGGGRGGSEAEAAGFFVEPGGGGYDMMNFTVRSKCACVCVCMVCAWCQNTYLLRPPVSLFLRVVRMIGR